MANEPQTLASALEALMQSTEGLYERFGASFSDNTPLILEESMEVIFEIMQGEMNFSGLIEEIVDLFVVTYGEVRAFISQEAVHNITMKAMRLPDDAHGELQVVMLPRITNLIMTAGAVANSRLIKSPSERASHLEDCWSKFVFFFKRLSHVFAMVNRIERVIVKNDAKTNATHYLNEVTGKITRRESLLFQETHNITRNE